MPRSATPCAAYVTLPRGLRDEPLGGGVAPSLAEGAPHCSRVGFGEVDPGGALASPAAGDGLEGGGIGPDEIVLLFERKLHHAPGFIGVGESGENLAGNAEIGMSHVRAFFRLREGEREFAKGGSRHASKV